MRRVLTILLVLAMMAGILAGGGVLYLAWEGRPAEGIPEGGKLFVLERGQAAQVTATRLEEEGLLRSALVFRALAKLRGEEGRLKSGTYRIMPAMGAAAILEAVTSGRQVLERVTVPEGSTLAQTAGLFEAAGVCAETEFRAAARDRGLLAELGIPGADAEGWLFPDTYFMPRDYPAADVLRAMVSALRSRLASIPAASALSSRELASRIILASIVEREYRVAEEAPLIAGVFDNRLRIGMALQSCATVAYVITERLGKPHPSVIYDRDLKLPDLYNTYAHPGLPPGPICSPGMTALAAAISPQPSSYLYFRLVDEAAGRHFFSATLDQHVKAGSLLVKRTAGQ